MMHSPYYKQTDPAKQAGQIVPKCDCGDRTAYKCPGTWEPGCDMGNNPKHARVYQPTPEERQAMKLLSGYDYEGSTPD